MSKKHKIKKKHAVAAPVKSTETRIGSAPEPPVKKTISSAVTLIHFDKRTRWFLLILLSAYILMSSLKIHTSNIGNWDLYFGKPESESVIAGKPRFIRMDEWMVSTPGVLSQFKNGMPVSNPGLGAENSPVVMGLPVKDIGALLRPSIWSYFIFDEEHAFAFSWNFNIFFSLITTFLLFLLLTKNDFWLSVFGSFFIFFSSGVQWWSYHIAYQMMYLNIMLLSFIYLLYSKKIWSHILAGIFLLFSINSFLYILYPAFQVPLIYLYLAIFIGFIWQRKNFQSMKENLNLKILVLSGTLIILGFFLYHYYDLVKESYAAMLKTVYPGKRFSVGGELANGKFFSEFFGMFMSDTHVPKQWLNICEESGFIIVFPIILYALIYCYIKSKKSDPLLVALSVYFIIGSIYVLVGFPAFLSKLSLLYTSPDYRALPIFEAGNAVLLICYLGNKQTEQTKKNISWTEFGILTVSIIIFIRMVSTQINNATENFFTAKEVNIVTVLVTLSYLLIRFKHYPFAKPALYIVLAIMNFSNLIVNPLTSGLSAVNENPLSKMTKEIHDKDPQARWAVFGKGDWESARLAQLLNINGINGFNGVKFVPPIKDMRILDSTGRYDSAYNRYAWIPMEPYIPGNDSVVIMQQANDGYKIFMDPCSQRLRKLNVKYFIFINNTGEAEVRCMIKVGEIPGLSVYKRNDE